MTALVITASYMGNLIAFLTVFVKPTTMKTLKETMKFDFPIYARRQDSLVADLLTASEAPIYQELRERLIFYDHFPDLFSVLKESKGMFLASTSYLEYQFMCWGSHELYILEEKIFPTYNVWAFQRGTVWRYQFDKYLKMMAATGLVDKWQRDFLRTFRVANKYFKEETDKHKIILRPLNLQDLEGAFIIFVFGHLFSLFILALENRHSLKHYLKKAKENVFWALCRLKTNIIVSIERRRRLCRKNNNRKKGKPVKPRKFFEEKLHEDIEALRKVLQMHQPKGGIGVTNTRDQERALLLSRQSTSTSLIVPQERNVEAELVQCSDVVETE
ncbi:uncharacterized protein LOC125030771 [Penaeus chinensis]|uniref:uncharacterized protein LOC125030771 n=1 Tax=Penaeus chinensis TaxID=139456 RepID=UPI001FB6382A|nr:uncharacterized protein LOC125030771 [Penaeus chinensis]